VNKTIRTELKKIFDDIGALSSRLEKNKDMEKIFSDIGALSSRLEAIKNEEQEKLDNLS